MSLNKKVVRENFRRAVFSRDGFKCLFCDETQNLDAHHIIGRENFIDGGYFLDNGATLCQYHHLKAEKNEITEKEIRDKISKRIHSN